MEIPKARAQALGITFADVFQSLQAKNLPAASGHISLGPERVAISPSGLLISEEEFRDLLIGSREGRLIRLGDIATISRGYEDPPRPMLRVDGRPAIGIAISTVLGGNVVTMGEAVEQRLAELQTQITVGMELEVIALQSETVVEAIDGFVVSLIQAVTIVFITLLVFLGLRSGLIIGFVTVLTMSATFLVMDLYDITLERISLGALVIVLGLLTDNAIVLLDAANDHGARRPPARTNFRIAGSSEGRCRKSARGGCSGLSWPIEVRRLAARRRHDTHPPGRLDPDPGQAGLFHRMGVHVLMR